MSEFFEVIRYVSVKFNFYIYVKSKDTFYTECTINISWEIFTRYIIYL